MYVDLDAINETDIPVVFLASTREGRSEGQHAPKAQVIINCLKLFGRDPLSGRQGIFRNVEV